MENQHALDISCLPVLLKKYFICILLFFSQFVVGWISEVYLKILRKLLKFTAMILVF
jgi:hypothetical protein